MSRRNFNSSGQSKPTGFSMQTFFRCTDGHINAIELLLPADDKTLEYVNESEVTARVDQGNFEDSLEVELAKTSARKPSRSSPMEHPIEPAQEPAEVISVPAVDGFLRVPCINGEDVLAEQKAAKGNTKFAERDRVAAMKHVTDALLARPMTRRVGVPADVHSAMQRLSELAPHIPELVEALRIPLLVSAATGAAPRIPPILLVGPAGVGKSHVALQIAQVLGVDSQTVSYSAAGAIGNVLSGVDKSWGNSSIGVVFKLLTEGEFANPVICLDEIDKASNSTLTSGPERNPLNELLALLEPVTSKEHRDRCSEIRVDARHIIWIATANSLRGLSAPLLSRFKLILVDKPDARAAVTIALSVTTAVSAELGAPVKPPTGEVLQFLATMTPRAMRRIWTAAAGWAIANRRAAVTMEDISLGLGVALPPEERLH